MTVQISNPAGLPDPTGSGYSHVACASGELVFIAGQYSCDPEGNPTGADFAQQVSDAFDNLGIALRSVGLDYADVAQLRTHVVEHSTSKLEVLGRQVADIWGSQPPPQTLAGVARLAIPGMSFEVDAIAVRSQQ